MALDTGLGIPNGYLQRDIPFLPSGRMRRKRSIHRHLSDGQHITLTGDDPGRNLTNEWRRFLGNGEEAGLHDRVDASAHARFLRYLVRIDHEEFHLPFDD